MKAVSLTTKSSTLVFGRCIKTTTRLKTPRRRDSQWFANLGVRPTLFTFGGFKSLVKLSFKAPPNLKHVRVTPARCGLRAM